MGTLRVRNHPLWVRKPKGHGPRIWLLHGGHSSSDSLLRSIGPRLSRSFAVGAYDRRGHGRSGDLPRPFDYDDMADEAIALLEHFKKRVFLLGYSDGGIVALKVAQRRPDLVKRIVVVGANFHVDGLVPSVLERDAWQGFDDWAARFGASNPDGLAGARESFAKGLDLYATQPTMSAADLAAISVPVLVMAGDDDVVAGEHTLALYRGIANAQLAILPGASHALLKEHPGLSVRIIRKFLKGPKMPMTFMPVRREPRGE